MIIAVDFDGTIARHVYPEIGQEVPGAIDWMIKFQQSGARLVLWTMRSGDTLTEAVKFCGDNGVMFYGINNNPAQSSWTSSPKAYAQIYIDDAAFGCPLIYPADGSRPYVDWQIVGPEVLKRIRNE